MCILAVSGVLVESIDVRLTLEFTKAEMQDVEPNDCLTVI